MKLFAVAAISLGLLCNYAYADTNSMTATPSSTTVSADQNKINGEKFLQKNKKNKDVVTLASGLQYKILKKGTGPKPTLNDNVTVNYVGTLINGKEFDSSKEPISFGVTQVIPGWTEALQLMPVGSTWMLYIPSELAYKDQNIPPYILPNSTLVFKVELVGIKK